MEKLRKAVQESKGDVMMDRKLFRRCLCYSKYFFLNLLNKKKISEHYSIYYTATATIVSV